MLTLYYKQSRDIDNLEQYSIYLGSLDEQYISHGEKVHYTERSSRDSMVDAMKLGIKINVMPTFVEQYPSDLKRTD